MRIVFALFLLVSGISLFAAEPASSHVTLIINMLNGQKILPPQFRMMSDPFKTTIPLIPTRYGLGDLNASGSAQFSENALDKILETLNKDTVLILDLREESHGFLNGNAISWYGDRDWANRGKTLAQIDIDEDKKLNDLFSQPNLIVYKVLQKNPNGGITSVEPLKMKVAKVLIEKDLVRKKQAKYLRIPVTDHLPPSDAAVENFLQMMKTLDPKMTWVHFHCAAGDGRTTTFMSMYDMYYNFIAVTFEDIIDRQWRIGGIQLTSMPPTGSWKYPGARARIVFLKKFYDYCHSRGPTTGVSWTTWNQGKS